MAGLAAYNAPCKDCKDRQLGCHSKCEKYRSYKEHAAEIAKKKKAIKDYLDFEEIESRKRPRF